MSVLPGEQPVLADRIRRIDPTWDGVFDYSTAFTGRQDADEATTKATTAHSGSGAKMTAAIAGTAVIDAMGAIEQVGNPTQDTIGYARTLIDELPATLKEAVREPYGARAIMYTLILNTGTTMRNTQLEYLQEHAETGVYALMNKITPPLQNLDTRYRLPLIELAIPALKQLSLSQYQALKSNSLRKHEETEARKKRYVFRAF